MNNTLDHIRPHVERDERKRRHKHAETFFFQTDLIQTKATDNDLINEAIQEALAHNIIRTYQDETVKKQIIEEYTIALHHCRRTQLQFFQLINKPK